MKHVRLEMQLNQQRDQIKPGTHVKIVLKRYQRNGKLTEGIVMEILTNRSTHPRGIKVRHTNNKIGRVQSIIE
jgi:uncharacterized repeat protein (TIGR03833 family)